MSTWYDSGGTVDNYSLEDYPERAMSKPYPESLWRIEANRNKGIPNHRLLEGVTGTDIWALRRERTIRVFDMMEPQDGFKSNGLAILHPVSCISRRDDTRWDIELVHPLDEWGKWKNLICDNILMVDGQLFRIGRCNPKIDPQSRTVSLTAGHITEDMGARLIADADFEGGSASEFMDFAFSAVSPVETADLRDRGYTFEGYTDITKTSGADNYTNTSLWAAFIGADNCFINRFGGELYRDNFYFSICTRMQYARNNAFNLRYSLDMTEIEQIIDSSELATELHAWDNYGNWYSVWWEGVRYLCGLARQKGAKFTYSSFEGAFEQLTADANALWERISFPKVTYRMQLANLRNDPRYADFAELQNYRYGDRGTVSCPELNITTTQQITGVERDELTGDIISLTLGNMSTSILRPSFMANTISSGNSPADRAENAMMNELKNFELKSVTSWNSAGIFKWNEMKKFKWKETAEHGSAD